MSPLTFPNASVLFLALCATVAGCAPSNGHRLESRPPKIVHMEFPAPLFVIDVGSGAGFEMQIGGSLKSADVALGEIYVEYRCHHNDASPKIRATLSITQRGNYSVSCAMDGALVLSGADRAPN